MDEMELMQDNYEVVELSEEEKQAITKVSTEKAMIIKAIKENEVALKNIKVATDKMKADLLKAMEEYGVKSIKNDDMVISYVAPSTRVTVDSKALKDEMPEVYKEYSKVSNVKASVRVKLK